MYQEHDIHPFNAVFLQNLPVKNICNTNDGRKVLNAPDVIQLMPVPTDRAVSSNAKIATTKFL